MRQHTVRQSTCILPRRTNLWVTDTLQWVPEAQLAQPANPVPVWNSTASAFYCSLPIAFRTSLPAPVNASPSEALVIHGSLAGELRSHRIDSPSPRRGLPPGTFGLPPVSTLSCGFLS